MKTRVHILFLTFLLYTVTLNAQRLIQIDTISVNYFNGITKKNEIIDNYQITNNSDEDYLTWVSLVPINNRTNIELIHDYFKKRKGDSNLIEMMCENLLNKQSINIGYSFIKNITANETFSYFIAKNEKASNFYSERIVLIKKKDVEQYLKMEIGNQYFYQFPNIFLIEK